MHTQICVAEYRSVLYCAAVCCSVTARKYCASHIHTTDQHSKCTHADVWHDPLTHPSILRASIKKKKVRHNSFILARSLSSALSLSHTHTQQMCFCASTTRTSCVTAPKLALRLLPHNVHHKAAEAVCCSVLQCVAECCSVLQHVAACCSMLQRVAAWQHWSVLCACCLMMCIVRMWKQCVAVWCSVLQYISVCCSVTAPMSALSHKFFEGGPLTHGSWWGNTVNRKPPRGVWFLSINLSSLFACLLQSKEMRPLDKWIDTLKKTRVSLVSFDCNRRPAPQNNLLYDCITESIVWIDTPYSLYCAKRHSHVVVETVVRDFVVDVVVERHKWIDFLCLFRQMNRICLPRQMNRFSTIFWPVAVERDKWIDFLRDKWADFLRDKWIHFWRDKSSRKRQMNRVNRHYYVVVETIVVDVVVHVVVDIVVETWEKAKLAFNMTGLSHGPNLTRPSNVCLFICLFAIHHLRCRAPLWSKYERERERER